jgi:hypothetical protein
MNAVGARTLEYLKGERDLFEERKRVAEVRKQVEAVNLSYWITGATKRRTKRFWQVVLLLQENSRMTLTEMSKRLKIPVSTVFETVKEVEKSFQFTIVLKDNVKDVSQEDTIAVGFASELDSNAEENTKPCSQPE